MKKSLFRIMAVFLILVFIINISPIRGSAIMPLIGWDSFALDLSHKIASTAIGIGTMPDEAYPDEWNTTIENAKQYLYSIVDDASKLANIYVKRDVDGAVQYFIEKAFAVSLRTWMFTTDVGSPELSKDTDTLAKVVREGLDKEVAEWCADNVGKVPHVYVFEPDPSSSTQVINVMVAEASIYKTANDYYRVIEERPTGTSGNITNFRVLKDGRISRPTRDVYPEFKYTYPLKYFYVGTPSFSTSANLVLGEIPDPAHDFGVGYSDWCAKAETIPAGTLGLTEDLEVIPIGLGKTQSETSKLTQQQVWQGESTYVDLGSITVPESVTLTDIWIAVTSIPASIAEFFVDTVAAIKAIPQLIADFFTPSGDITMYSLDLKELFPFCIPFDLFDLLSALRADPVAPVFELELDFGITKAPIVVDLSGWSDLAAIVRILEVGLFCVGLALGTKELIGS